MTFPEKITPSENFDLAETMLDRLVEFQDLLVTSGAVLFRGFNIRTEAEFRAAVAPILGPPMVYTEGASPRTSLGDGVYTSTEYDPRQPIPLHNELSYASTWPAALAFCCLHPPEAQGATPIADSRKVFNRLAVHAEALPDAVVYTRTMTRDAGAGVSWSSAFGTSDPLQVEAYCDDHDIDWEWGHDHILRTRQRRPAAIEHPVTGEPVWFNQAHQWHPSGLGAETASILNELYGDDLPMNVKDSDGSDIKPLALQRIRDAIHAETVRFDWEMGDVLVLDNMLSAHGREPYTGTRKIVVAMGRPVQLSGVTAIARHGAEGESL